MKTWTLALLGLLIAGMPAAAEQSSWTQPYVWRSWTRLDGLPGSQVWTITQDHSGYIWLGTNEGLVRFDGVRFVSAHDLGFDQLPEASIRALLVARDGSLWIGFGPGGISNVQGHAVRNFTTEDGLPQGVITALLEDARGVMWASSGNGLYRLQEGRWQLVDPAAALTTRVVFNLHEDRQGRLWIGTPAGVYRSASGAPRSFEHITTMRAESFAEDDEGHVWGTGDGSTLALLTSNPPRRITETDKYAAGRRLVSDQEGRLWIATVGSGLLRVGQRNGVTVDQLNGSGVLSSDVIRSIFRDREGNIWLGTPRGLDRGSEGLIRSLPEPGDNMVTLVQAVATASDGSVWVGTGSGLYRFPQGARQSLGAKEGLPSQVIVALHGDSKGRMWIATNRGIGRFEGGRFVRVVPEGALSRPVAMVTDRDDVLWICDFERGVFRWDSRTLTALHPEQHGDHAAFSIMADSKGRIWTGHVDGTVAVHDAGRSRLYTSSDGLPGGMVTGFYEDGRGTIWLGSVGGLVRFQDGRFDAITWKRGLPGNIVTAINGDEAGNIWLGVSSGIVRLRPEDFETAVRGSATPLRHVLYDGPDGVRGDPLPLNPPAVARGGDGRLWFLTSDGMAIVSPSQHVKNRLAPPVVIEAIAVDQRPFDPGSAGHLPSRTANLRIDYTALSFVAPEKVRFEYLMEGFDTNWVDAGTRRQAFYTNLPPGDYRFRVRATNDGVPSDHEAIWTFTHAPAFYQTPWFAAAMVGLVLTIGALAWQARVHQVRGKFSAILVERTRMAREIHDTLLQSLLGVLFRLDEVANLIDISSESAKEQLGRLRYQVEFYVREARHSIKDLRSPILQSRGLPTAVRAVGERLAGEGSAAFQLDVVGTPRSDSPRVDEQLLRIAQEAITNSVRHGHAAAVRVELNYRPESVALRICDDGTGFDTARAIASDGVHWGLATMNERAQQIGGTLRVDSADGRGTVVEVVAPLPA